MVFEGRSFALDADGAVVARAPAFEEKLVFAQVEQAQAAIKIKADVAPLPGLLPDLWHALVLGVRDYIGKNGFPGVLLGLSGGIDSALVLALAVDALGKGRVRTVMMPSPYTADISWIDARDMAGRLGVSYEEIDIRPAFEAFKASLAPQFAGKAEDTTEENLQARIRGTLLMALSNKFGSLVLTTGNKSELATGYCTLYGDMAGGFAPIKDVPKTQVFALARWRNANDPFNTGANPIPERIITRPPSAELRPGQTDQDSLPPYEVLDAIIARYMENDEAMVARVEELLLSRKPRIDQNLTLITSILEAVNTDKDLRTVEMVTERFSISERTVQYLFKKYVGVGLKWVLMRYRLLEAVELAAQLKDPNWALVAADLGYSHQSHFVNDFKKLVGKAPEQYAQSIRAK